MSEPLFFEDPSAFYEWLREHHDKETEVWIGFHRKKFGKPTIAWSEAVDQALCWGWIDGIRKSIDDVSYMNRFTPRKPTSNWSAVNLAKVEELEKRGLMQPPGRAAFERRRTDRTAIYSYEQRKNPAFTPEQLAEFQAEAAAWEFFSAQPPYYRRTATYWVISAKREETRARRLRRLIEDSEAGRRLAHLSSPPKKDR